jgi:RNA polymerase sigma-70 factor (ECF subfamily)
MPVNDFDLETVELARAGDRAEAMRRFDEMHGARLVAACRRLTGSASDGEDAFQEVLLQVDRSLARFRGEAGLYTWAFRIAVNVCLNVKRGLAWRTPHVPLEDASTLLAGAGSGGDPDFSCVASFRTWVVERALLALPDGQRQALVLCDIEEMTAPEAGALLGVDANAVKQRLHRARRRLRDVISREFAARGVALEGFEGIGCTSGLFRGTGDAASRLPGSAQSP